MLAALRVGEEPGRLSDWQAFVLGVTQGASELLPISSSGHLILVPWIANWHYLEENPVFNKTFDVSLHLGTLVAVVVYFWNDVVRYAVAWFRSVRARAIRNADERLAWAIAIATVPAAIVGALGENAIDHHLGEPWQIAFFLAFFAILLWIADRSPQRGRLSTLRLPTARRRRRLADPRADARRLALRDHDHHRPLRAARPRRRRALLVPAADPDRARRRALQGPEAHRARPAAGRARRARSSSARSPSAAVGLVAIDLLLGYVRRHSYLPFVIYRLVLAALIVIAIASGWRDGTF